MSLLEILTILCIGPMIGTEIAVSAFINPGLAKLDQSSYLSALKVFAQSFGKAMPFWYVAGLILLIAEAVVRRQTPQLPLLIVAAAIWSATIVFTIAVLVPINNRLARQDVAAPNTDWRAAHTKWDHLHRLRVLLLIASFVCFLWALRTASY